MIYIMRGNGKGKGNGKAGRSESIKKWMQKAVKRERERSTIRKK